MHHQLTQDKNYHRIKTSPTKAGGKIGGNLRESTIHFYAYIVEQNEHVYTKYSPTWTLMVTESCPSLVSVSMSSCSSTFVGSQCTVGPAVAGALEEEEAERDEGEGITWN